MGSGRWQKAATIAAAVAIPFLLIGCSGSSSSSTSAAVAAPPVVRGVKPQVEVPSGSPPDHLVVKDLLEGDGPPAKSGHKITVQFVGLRWNGEPLQSSWEGGKVDPFTFRLHNDPPEVMPGWERGLLGMREGGRRQLVVPPRLIYRPGQITPSTLGPDDTAVYVVELLKAH